MRKYKQKQSKNANYISSKESLKISRFNRRLTRKLERRRAGNHMDPAGYTTVMKDNKNVVEFDNLCTYFLRT
jgi:peptide/nickel transport system ATP-binding protein